MLNEIRLVKLDAVRPLRAAILRPNQPFATSIYIQDEELSAFHIAAYESSDQIYGVASAYLATVPEVLKTEVIEPEKLQMWRMRGVAVMPEERGKGIGRQLIAFLEAEIQKRASSSDVLLWANAREGALPFYVAIGYEGVGAFFELPKIGLHQVIWRRFARKEF